MLLFNGRNYNIPEACYPCTDRSVHAGIHAHTCTYVYTFLRREPGAVTVGSQISQSRDEAQASTGLLNKFHGETSFETTSLLYLIAKLVAELDLLGLRAFIPLATFPVFVRTLEAGRGFSTLQHSISSRNNWGWPPQ